MNFYSAPSSHPLLRGAPNYSADTVLEFSRRSAVSVSCEYIKNLLKVPTQWFEAGFVLATYRSTIHDVTSEPPRPTQHSCLLVQPTKGKSACGLIRTTLNRPCIVKL